MPKKVTGAEHDMAARRKLVRALAADRPAALAAWLDGHRLGPEDLIWLAQQGLVVFAFHRLEEAGLHERLPDDLAAQWQEIYQQATVMVATADWEIEHILLALAEAGVEFVWMKGGALAYAVYPNPATRWRGDLDLWIQPGQVTMATSVLNELGYSLHHKEDRPDALVMLVGGELQLVKRNSPVGLIELQWPVLRGEWVRHTTAGDPDAIWQRRTSVAVGGHTFAAMAPEDALIHLCLHQAIHHQFSAPWLRNLLDVHLLIGSQALDWPQVTERATAWRLATVVWTVLSLAQRLLDTKTPQEVMHALAPPRWRRRLISRLRLEEALLTLRPGGYGYRRFAIQLALVDRSSDIFRLLWHAIFPDADWLRARYRWLPGQRLWRLRLRHLWSLAFSARA